MLYSNIFGLVVDMNRVDVVLKTGTLQTHCSQIIFKTKTIENTFKNQTMYVDAKYSVRLPYFDVL